MIVLKNLTDLQNQKQNINPNIVDSIELDLKTIEECYETQDDKYGPLVVVADPGEEEDVKEKFPILKVLEEEDSKIVYSGKIFDIYRVFYYVSDAGIVVYQAQRRA